MRVCVVALSAGAAAMLSGCTPVQAPGPDQYAAPPSQPRGAAAAFDALVPPAAIGEPVLYLDDFITQDGALLAATGLADKTIVVTFFESRSPAPELCPALLERLAYVQRRLRPDLWPIVHMVAISVDPAYDRSRLRQIGEQLNADFNRWTFAAAPASSLEQFAARLGVVMWERRDGTVGHTLNTVVIDGRGRLADRFPGVTQWTPDDLLASIVLVAER